MSYVPVFVIQDEPERAPNTQETGSSVHICIFIFLLSNTLMCVITCHVHAQKVKIVAIMWCIRIMYRPRWCNLLTQTDWQSQQNLDHTIIRKGMLASVATTYYQPSWSML